MLEFSKDLNLENLKATRLIKVTALDYIRTTKLRHSETELTLLQKKPFIVFSTFNNSISELTKYADDYVVYDQSTNENWVRENEAHNALKRLNIGHSLSNVFEYILENWENFPETTTFLKANVVPRHCDQDYFDLHINNNYYTHFYNDADVDLEVGINEILFPGYYLEVNNSWYMERGNHALFCTFDEFAGQLFKNYTPSKYVLFCPGACFTVTKSQVKKHPKELYRILHYAVSYRFFPDEAYIVERILPSIFLGSYVCNENLETLLTNLKQKKQENDAKCEKHSPAKISTRIFKKMISNYRRKYKVQCQ